MSHNIHYLNYYVILFMEKIIGFVVQSGEFNGIKYSNYVLTSDYQYPADKGRGTNCKQYKIKASYIDSIIKSNGLADIDSIIGLNINNPYEDIYYDNNKRIKMIKFGD